MEIVVTLAALILICGSEHRAWRARRRAVNLADVLAETRGKWANQKARADQHAYELRRLRAVRTADLRDAPIIETTASEVPSA